MKLRMRVEVTGNEKEEQGSNQAAFLTKVYREGFCRVKGEGLWMASTAVCNEKCTEPPQCDPRSHHFHQELPITHLGLILQSRKVGR